MAVRRRCTGEIPELTARHACRRMSSSSGRHNSHGGVHVKSEGRSAPQQPLRRGDACLMCRAKKLKCSATKPTCDQCAKRRDRCVYDAVRPASRVERLERKLAEMDEQDLQEALAARRHSVSAASSTPLSMSFPPATTIPSQGSYATYPPVFDLSGFSFPNSIGPIDASGTNRCSGEWQQPRALSAPDALVGLPGLGWTAGSSTPSTSTGVAGSMSLDWQSLNGTNSLEPQWDNGLTASGNGFPYNGSFSNTSVAPDAQTSFLGVGLDPSSSLMNSPSTYPAGLSSSSPLLNPLPATSTAVTGNSSSASFHLSSLQFSPDGQSYIPTLNADSLGLNEDASKIQLQERDISQSARDYLLDLFFAPPREPFGSECWTEGQFRARLDLPPGQRPHSCLLLAMYMTAASGSYIPAVRSLADSLYGLAVVKLDEAIQKQDRILDATNAAKMLCKWLFARARALEAYQMAYKMVSLALVCRLHQIPTGIFDPNNSVLMSPETWPIIGPPKDQWELGQRIHAFWGIWGNDIGSSFMLPWPRGLRDENVTTPLPRKPEEYLDGSVKHQPDVTFRDLYLDPTKICTFDSPIVLLALATHLLARARGLRDEPREDRSSFSTPIDRSIAGRFIAHESHPRAYAEIMTASRNLQEILKATIPINPLGSPPWQSPDVAFAHIAVVAARMLLHNGDSTAPADAARDVCLSDAHEIAGTIQLWIRQIHIQEANEAQSRLSSGSGTATASGATAGTTRNRNGIGGPYFLYPWVWTAEKLRTGAQSHRAVGNETEAIKCERDAKMIIEGLKTQNVHWFAGAKYEELISSL